MLSHRLYVIGLTIIILTQNIHTYVLITANVEDVKSIARKFLPATWAEHIAEYVYKVINYKDDKGDNLSEENKERIEIIGAPTDKSNEENKNVDLPPDVSSSFYMQRKKRKPKKPILKKSDNKWSNRHDKGSSIESDKRGWDHDDDKIESHTNGKQGREQRDKDGWDHDDKDSQDDDSPNEFHPNIKHKYTEPVPTTIKSQLRFTHGETVLLPNDYQDIPHKRRSKKSQKNLHRKFEKDPKVTETYAMKEYNKVNKLSVEDLPMTISTHTNLNENAVRRLQIVATSGPMDLPRISGELNWWKA